VELDRAITRALTRLTDGGPTAPELERCRAQAEANFIYRLQTVGGFGGKSDQLNAYNTYIGDPGFFESDLARYRRVSPEGMQAASREWLAPEARVVLSVVPTGRSALALPGSNPVAVS
jgi:zinc protease